MDKDRQIHHDKINAEIAKLIAETAKINKETKWYEFVIMAAIIVGCIAAGRFFF